MAQKLKYFIFEGKKQRVEFLYTERFPNGTTADIYGFVGDTTKDLAIFKTQTQTPKQLVRHGDRTVEGYISGNATLYVQDEHGNVVTHRVGKNGVKALQIDVKVGEIMQWVVEDNSLLIGYEVCFPPWTPGRYIDLED